MAIADIQSSFGAGELSPSLYGRVDLAKYEVGAALLRNFLVDYRGGARYRPGTKFIAECKDLGSDPAPRLLPFIVSTDASYVLELGNLYIRVYSLGVQIQEVVTPYVRADLALLKYAQSADVMTLVHPSYPPATLTRTNPTTFVYAPIVIGSKITAPIAGTCEATKFDQFNYDYVVTAVSISGKEESVPSAPYGGRSAILDETKNYVENLNWTAPAEAVSQYNIYKWGPIKWNNPAPSVWGLIGSTQSTWYTDNNIAPDYTKEPPRFQDPWSGGQLQSISVLSGGAGYNADGSPGHASYIPLSISGDGAGAAGFAVMRSEGDGIAAGAGFVAGAFFTNPGKGYTTATATAVGAGGTGATFTIVISDIAPLYPSCVAYVQQRQCFAAPIAKPETIVMSQTGNYVNFDTSPISLDTDAISLSISSLEVNTIKAMVPVAYGLIAFTTGGTFLINGGTPGAAITPSSVSAQAQASEGANDVPPLRINFDVLYIQNKGNRVRDLAFAWQRQSYTGSDISSLAAHLFDDYTTVEWCWSQEPFKIVSSVRSDGRLLICTYVPDQEVYAWSRHDTQGLFKSVCSVPEGDINAIYVVVQRFLPGGEGCGAGWVNYLERFMPTKCCIYDSWFLDSAVTLPVTTPDFTIFASGTEGNIELCAPEVGASYIRGPNVSYNALYPAGNFDLYSTQGMFDFVMPSDWDNTSNVDPFYMDIIGGVLANSAAPTTFDSYVSWGIYTVNGDSALTAPLSSSGLSYAIGSVVKNTYNASTSPDWTTIGLNQARLGGFMDPTTLSSLAATLVDGTVVGYPGEGFKVASTTDGPMGWYPQIGLSSVNDGTAHTKLTAGQTVTFWIYLFSDCTDSVNPDRSVFGAIQSITLRYKGTSYPVNLSTMKVGWSAGASYVPYLGPGGAVPTQYPNPLRTIELTPPPIGHPNQQTFIDFYRVAGTTGPFAGVSIGDVVNIGCGKVSVTSVESEWQIHGDVIAPLDISLPDDPTGVPIPILPGTWNWVTPVSVVTGLNHLNGKTVTALADGLVIENLEVVTNAVTLPRAASSIVVGLPYVGQIQTLYLNIEGIQPGTMQGKRKLQPAVTLRLDCTQGLECGIDFEHMSHVTDDNAPVLTPPALMTGDVRHVVFTDWNTEGQICVQQRYPLPATVLGIIAEVVPGDTVR